MNAIDLLKDDHREVERLFCEFLAAEDSEAAQREEIFRQLEKELLVHGDIEEEIFYPAIENFAQDEVEQALREHQKVKELLADLLEIELDEDSFDKKLTALMECIQHHVQEEEGPGGILEIARAKLDENRLQKMAKQMLELKRQSQGKLAA